MSEGSAASRSKLALWLGAFAGFYRPAVEEVRRLDAVSKFLYSARSVILVISAQAAVIAGLLALAARRFDALAFVLVLAFLLMLVSFRSVTIAAVSVVLLAASLVLLAIVTLVQRWGSRHERSSGDFIPTVAMDAGGKS